MEEAIEGTQGQKSLNTILLRKLSSAVNGHAATATFACGGSIPISGLPTVGTGGQNVFPPVTLRRDRSEPNKCRSITFPLPGNDRQISYQQLQLLMHACQPATFGFGGQDVLDESYRKALKLDPSAFSTNFHPHDRGIIDSVQQILLPSTIKGGQGVGIGPEGIRAELYKLNVCYCHSLFGPVRS